MKLIIKTFILALPVLFLSSFIYESEPDEVFIPKKLASPIELIKSDWVNSILDTLTLEEKISQLIMIPAYANMDSRYEQKLHKTINEKQIGGVILMRGEPYKSTKLINSLQEQVDIPLMVAIDGEWGPAMRIDSVLSFPKAMPLGAIQNDQSVFNVGVEIAKQCKRMGIHINFAPVIDINTKYNNPIINMRAFGSHAKSVARKGLAYAIGMQSNGIMAVGKHFPGHGSTYTDSHKTLPIVYHSKEQLMNIDMFPFEKMIHNELGGVMVAHISYPALDARINRPASLSVNIIDSLLVKKLGFKGLVFTDALNMKGVTKFYKPGEIELEALKAGNDVLLYPENIDAAVNRIVKAVNSGELAENIITEKCRKVLKAKQWFGLNNYKPANIEQIKEDLNSINANKVNYISNKESLTLIENKADLLPFSDLENLNVLVINIGDKQNSSFENGVQRYVRADVLDYEKKPSSDELAQLNDALINYSHVLLVQHGVSEWPFHNFNLKQWHVELAQLVSNNISSVLIFSGNPYALRNYNNIDAFNSILITYGNNKLILDLASQSLFGGICVSGRLPIDISEKYRAGAGYSFDAIRLEYIEPYVMGLNEKAFSKVDSLIEQAIKIKATPGCQVVFVKNGRVLYNKSFGYHTYGKKQLVEWSHLYDIASVTKVAATTISLMKLYDENLIDPVAKLSNYFPELKTTDKKAVRINQILAHHSGMRSWIPFYRNTIDDKGNLRQGLYSNDSLPNYSIKVANNLYLRNDYVDSVYKAIIDTPIYKKKKYRYSDLGFYWLAELVKLQSKKGIDSFVHDHYFKPLGMGYTLYNPWRNSYNYTIIPSEDDKLFRKQKIIGYVHDQGAALLGGVSGHAGLFSNANDLAKLGQLLLNKGIYGGKAYFSSKTLDVFNKQYYKRKGNRRALGFDKAPLKEGSPGPTCLSASPESFGHSGFTGTYFWVDPIDESVFVFLSNRTYPSQENKKLVQYDFRTNIHQAFYDVFNQDIKKLKENM